MSALPDWPDCTSVARIEAAGLTIIQLDEGAELSTYHPDPWQIAYDIDYCDILDYRVYAGSIFRDTSDDDLQSIAIPDEDDARQLMCWLNEREALLLASEAWRDTIDALKAIPVHPRFEFDIIGTDKQERHISVDPWQMAYDTDYCDTLDYRVYAGSIFRDTSDDDLQSIAIPDEDHARQLMGWLNQREALLVASKAWQNAIQQLNAFHAASRVALNDMALAG
jgi:hypothetical protein